VVAVNSLTRGPQPNGIENPGIGDDDSAGSKASLLGNDQRLLLVRMPRLSRLALILSVGGANSKNQESEESSCGCCHWYAGQVKRHRRFSDWEAEITE
jgi:hypothetical protein